MAVTRANGLMTCRMVRGQRNGKTALAMRVALNMARKKVLVVKCGLMAQSSLGSGEATKFMVSEGRSGLMAADILESFLKT